MSANAKSLSESTTALSPPQTTGGGWLATRCRRILLRRLQDLRHGALLIRDGVDEWRLGEATAEPVVLTVADQRCWPAWVFGGTNGAGAAFIDGWWQADDLVGLVRLLCRNEVVLAGLDRGWARWLGGLRRLGYAWLQRNTRRGADRHIRAHYDLGNDLFELMLDPQLFYSAAIFARPDDDLATAQLNKCAVLAERLAIRPGDHVLEIGTGWGGLAIYLAQQHDCRVTTTTISREQYREAERRIAAAGLGDRITLLLQDYRDLDGCYDRIVSVEMIEAVGWQYYETFFQHLRRLLRPEGVLVMQAILIGDDRFERSKQDVDFIKRYVFPGSCIPSVTALTRAASRASDLRLLDSADYTPHYAKTLACWRARCSAAVDQLDACGYDERFRRMWHYYLCYCEGGFAERAIGCQHLRWAGPGYRSADHQALGYTS